MAGLVPAIHVFLLKEDRTWMPGTRPGMTNLKAAKGTAAKVISDSIFK
jgi:hypothetical protein